jgi:hypothetical protein
MNSLYEKENLLPYVTEENVPVAPKPSIFKLKLNKNGLATAAFIFALSSIVLGLLLIPSILGIALGVGALIVAAKRGLPKKMPIISIAISAVTLVLSTVGIIFLFFAVTPDSKPYVPPAYTYVESTGVAYKYNPISNIPCDNTGKCAFEVKLFPIDSSKCSKGGSFIPNMQDLATKITIPADPLSFPALKNGEEQTLSVTLQGDSNSRLIEVGSSPILCK